MIPMDDLLPASDDAFEPVNSGEFFETGSAFWESADFYKWSRPKGADNRHWMRVGFMAAIFETALKSGRPFMMRMDLLQWTMFADRAREYGRTARINEANILVVSGHPVKEKSGG